MKQIIQLCLGIIIGLAIAQLVHNYKGVKCSKSNPIDYPEEMRTGDTVYVSKVNDSIHLKFIHNYNKKK
jgi:hypothetical protein